MGPPEMTATANLNLTLAASARGTRKQLFECALALPIMLGLAALPPSAQAQTLTVLHSFTGGADGNQPMGLVRDSAGNLYGTSLYGGVGFCSLSAGCGTVFKLDAAGNHTVLHAFTGGVDGSLPWATLTRDSAGNLYGATLNGGAHNCDLLVGCGTVFKLDAAGNKTVLYMFPGSAVGSLPYGLIRDANGNFYGTTPWGGGGGCLDCGTVFKLDSAHKETVLHGFAGGADGSLPYAGVVRDSAGNVFGTTYQGGAFKEGTVFKVDSTGKETVLHSFGSGEDGAYPIGGLVPNGQNLYGTTSMGGEFGLGFTGTVFKLGKAGQETVVYSFSGGSDGGQPTGNMVHDAAGNLYGTTSDGGASGYGTVFKVDASGKETVLHSFAGGADGQYPAAGVILDAAGNLYGTTLSGGANNCGTVFKIAP